MTPGTRFHVLGGFERIAVLEVEAVADKGSTARVVETTVPQIAKGTPVRSETLTGADYFVYYGNPKPEGTSPAWAPPATPVRRYTWQITSGSAPTAVPMLQQQMRTGVSYVGASSLESASSRANPHASDALRGMPP